MCSLFWKEQFDYLKSLLIKAYQYDDSNESYHTMIQSHDVAYSIASTNIKHRLGCAWKAHWWANYGCLLCANLGFVNTLMVRTNGHHFPDGIFKCIFLNEIVLMSIKISLKFVFKGPINNRLALVQIMAWCWSGNKHLNQWWLVYWCMYALFGLNELKHGLMLPSTEHSDHDDSMRWK